MKPDNYSFRLVRERDLPLLRGWLRQPEVMRWWGDPDEQIALIEGDLDDPRMITRIVSCDGKPFAYAQDYAVDDWPQEHFSRLKPRSRAIDTFIGDPETLGKGHGAAHLGRLAERLVAEGAPQVDIDPDPLNVRARKAYGNAGFRGEDDVETPCGPAVVMVFVAVGDDELAEQPD